VQNKPVHHSVVVGRSTFGYLIVDSTNGRIPLTDPGCVFCKLVAGEIPSTKLYEDDELLAFEDINPVAPVHFLVIPKLHVATLDDVEDAQSDLLGRMLIVAAELARKKGVSESGYRQLINCREPAGQTVFHLHLHILGGRPMGPMG
jgi:histidine triad (HIT) family protein